MTIHSDPKTGTCNSSPCSTCHIQLVTKPADATLKMRPPPSCLAGNRCDVTQGNIFNNQSRQPCVATSSVSGRKQPVRRGLFAAGAAVETLPPGRPWIPTQCAVYVLHELSLGPTSPTASFISPEAPQRVADAPTCPPPINHRGNSRWLSLGLGRGQRLWTSHFYSPAAWSCLEAHACLALARPGWGHRRVVPWWLLFCTVCFLTSRLIYL